MYHHVNKFARFCLAWQMYHLFGFLGRGGGNHVSSSSLYFLPSSTPVVVAKSSFSSVLINTLSASIESFSHSSSLPSGCLLWQRFRLVKVWTVYNIKVYLSSKKGLQQAVASFSGWEQAWFPIGSDSFCCFYESSSVVFYSSDRNCTGPQSHQAGSGLWKAACRSAVAPFGTAEPVAGRE